MVGFKIPLPNTQAREAMDIGHVAEVLSPENRAKVPTMAQALRQARQFMAECNDARSVAYICQRADTAEFWLISVGRRGGWKRVWNFGDGR